MRSRRLARVANNHRKCLDRLEIAAAGSQREGPGPDGFDWCAEIYSMNLQMSRDDEPGKTCSENAERAFCFSLISGPDAVNQIAADWTRMIRGGGDWRFFHRPEWYRGVTDLLRAGNQEMRYFTVRRGVELVAVLPMCATTRRIGGLTVRVLGLVEHAHVSLCDFVIRNEEDRAQLLHAFFGWLERQREIGWDMLDLSRVPERSAIAAAFATERISRVVQSDIGFSSYIPVADGYENVAQGLSGSFKRNLRRLSRRAEDSAPLEYRVITDPMELRKVMDVFLRVESSGWKGVGGTASAIVFDASLVEFYQYLADAFGATGECAICLLSHGDRAVAAQFCLCVNGTHSILKIGFDEALGEIAPGNLIMERTIRMVADAAAVRELSFVTSPPWGHLWKPRKEAVRSYRVFNRTVLGRALFLALHVKRVVAWGVARVTGAIAELHGDGHGARGQV